MRPSATSRCGHLLGVEHARPAKRLQEYEESSSWDLPTSLHLGYTATFCGLPLVRLLKLCKRNGQQGVSL